MENSKALLNFDILGWLTAIIEIQIRILCKQLTLQKSISPKNYTHIRYKNVYSYFILTNF